MTLFYGDITDEHITAKMTKPDNGWKRFTNSIGLDIDSEHEYLVTQIEIGGFSTDIYLEGENRVFNSVNFTFYKDGKEIDIIEYFRPRFRM